MEQVPGKWGGMGHPGGQTGVRSLQDARGRGLPPPKEETVRAAIGMGGWHSRPRCDASLGLSLPFTKESKSPPSRGINKVRGLPAAPLS